MSLWDRLPHVREEYRRREYEALHQQLLAIEAQERRRLIREQAPFPPQATLRGTLHGLRILHETVQQLLDAGELWWSEEP